jgi:hypothetical protein
VRRADERSLTLRQADQARTGFALIEDHLEFVMGQLARLPTRAYLCRGERLGLADCRLAYPLKRGERGLAPRPPFAILVVPTY